MSHFYGTLQGCAGQATRRGHKSSGIQATAASWEGAVSVELKWNEPNQCNEYIVKIHPWQGRGPVEQVIACGILRHPTEETDS